MTPEEQHKIDELERRLAETEKRLSVLEAASLRRRVSRGIRRRGGPVLPHIETTFGMNWLSRIAVVTAILALAFFFEYAFQNHWLSEWGGVLLGVACGGAALGGGERFRRGGQRAYGQTLASLGIAFFYLSCWAASSLYHLVPAGAGFALMALVTAGAGGLARRYDSPVVAALGLGGGFATPLLLGHPYAPWFVLGYVLVLDAGAALASRVTGWKWLEQFAFVGTAIVYFPQSWNASGDRLVHTAFLSSYFALFAAGTLPAVFVIAQVYLSIMVGSAWSRDPGGIWILAAWAAAGLVVADRREWRWAAGGAFVGFWLAYPWLPGSGEVPLTAVFVLSLAWPLWRAYGRHAALRPLDLLLVALNAGLYFGAMYGRLQAHEAEMIGMLAVAIALVELALSLTLWHRDREGSVLAAGIAWVFLVLAVPLQFAGYRVTIVWAAEGAALAWVAVRFRERRAELAALAVFALVIVRLGLIDSRMRTLALVANPRFFTFVVSAAGLFATAWWIRTGRRAGAAYLAANAVLLWGICLEAVAWAERVAAPENFRSVASASISVLAGGYALLLVAAGAVRSNRPTRLMGMGLIGLVVLKLYCYDVWLLGAFYRMAAFAILGSVLLVISYLFRPRVR